MLSADSHSVSLGQGHGHAHGHGHVRFFNSGPGASSGSHSQGYDHDHGHSNAVAPTQLQQHHHHHHHHYNYHIQGHGLAAFPPPTSSDASSSTGALAPSTAQVARLVRNHASPLTRTRSAPPRALALPASAQQQPGSAAVADNGHPHQPPKKKLRPSHPLPLSTSTSSSTPTAAAFRVPAVHRPLPITGVSANYDADAFARLAVGARSGYATRPPVVDAGMAAASAMAVTVVDRRVQAQAVRRMRERAVERAGVVQWLVHLNAIHASFRFAPETIYTGVQYMDRALASSPTARKHLAPRKPHMYLLAVVCLTLAAKFAEEYAAPSVAGILAALAAVPPPPAAAGVVQALMPAWTQKHVLAMERKVLEALHFDLAAVAPSAAVFELLFANVDLAVELCALVMSGGQSAGVSPTVATPRSSPMSTSPAASSAAPPAAAGFLSPGASPRSSGSSTSSAGMVPPSPVSPTGAFDHEVFMAPPHMHTSQSHQQHQASRTSFGIAAAARPFPPPIAPPAHVSSAAQAKWTMYSAPGPTDLAQDQPDAAAAAADADAGDLSPMDVDPSPADHGMCMVTPPHTPPRAPAAAGSGSPARSSTPSDERWPAALSSPTHRNLIARLVRAVQTELVQRVLVHAQGTAHAPLNTAVVLLNRAVVCLAAANKAAAAVSMPAGGTGLDPSPMATPGATGTVTVSGTGAAVAQVAGIVSRVQCVVTEERGRGEWGACVEMVRQAVGGQVVGLAA